AGLKMRPAVTNLLLNSEQLGVGGFVDSNITVTANNATAPDGSLTADSLVTSTVSSLIRQSSTTAVGGAVYTYSAWLKSNTGANQTIDMSIRDITGSNWVANHAYVVGNTISAS